MSHRTPTVPDLSLKIIDAGRLQLLNVLGAGAYGTVYRARDRMITNEKPVFYAVKVQPLVSRNSSRGTIQMREINFHNVVSAHPNVVTMHRIVQDETYLYIVTDFCPGGDMFDMLIDGVHSCHEQSVYHRDLKPENVLLNKERNQLYVADFGLATRNISSNSFGAGSAYYMSPECMNSRGDPRPYNTCVSDVWSLGIILVNMITGRSPWSRAAHDDECYCTYLEDPNFFRNMLPVSRSAARVLRRVLADDPLERIDLPSLRRLVEEVDTFFMSEEDVAASSDPVQAAWMAYRPHEKIIPLPVFMSLDWASWLDGDSGLTSSDLSESDDSTSDSSSGDSADVPFCFTRTVKTRFALLDSTSADSLSADSEEFSQRVPLYVRNKTSSDNLSNGSSEVSFLETRSSEEDESEGPETPETYAQDAGGAVLEISQSVYIGDALSSTADLDRKRSHSGAGVDTMQRFIDNLLVI